MRAMATNVVKGAQLIVIGANDEDVFIAQSQGDVITDFGQHRLMGDILPGFVKNLPLFEFVDIR